MRSDTQASGTAMKLTDLSYDSIREATLTDLYNISEQAGIQDEERLSHSEDLRDRLILMKRKMEGTSNSWKPLFRSVQGETKVKIDSLVHLMKTVEDTFQTIPTESLSEILRKEGHLQSRNLLEEISTRLRNLKERRSLVVVAGETNGGKSTFLNLLLGEDILPTYVLHCTFVVCKIVYSDVYSIKTLDYDDVEEHFPCSSREEVKAILKNKVTQPETKDREFESPIKEITLGLPADILKSGVVLVDTPGIGENEVMDTVTMNFVKSTHASAFIYIIKSDTAGGVQEDRLLSFLRAIKDRYSSDEMMEAFDPRAAMFVCHRWDNIEEKHREKVKLNALDKLAYVWPGFDKSQTYFFSTSDTMKHLPVDPEFVTDSYMVLLKGLKHIFDRACHNAIKHQYVWLKYMLQPASHHLKSMITHCIMSNEELEEYFRSVSVKQSKLMISSTENSRKLQTELGKMSSELKSLISNYLNFDSSNPCLEIQDCEEMIELCSRENFLVSQANRRSLDEMIVRSLLKRVDNYGHLQNVVSEMESKILMDIQDHLGLFKCQISQIKQDMLHGLNPRFSPSHPVASLNDSATQLRSSTDSIASIGLNTSSLEAFQGFHTQGPSQLSKTVQNLLVRRKEGKPTIRTIANSKLEIGQSLLGKIGDRIRHGVFNRTDPAVYVEERIQKVSRDIREDTEIMDSIVSGYTEWIQQCMTYAVECIPKFIEVNTKLMEEIRDHRTIFQRNKDLLVKVMENLEPCRHNLRGYGMLYMKDINAETLAFNTEHRTSTVSLPKYLLTGSGRSVDSGFQERVDDCLWSRMQGATIEVDNVGNRVIIKTYTYDLDEKLILPEIASLRCLDYTNLAPFLGMTRISTGSTRSQPLSPIDPDLPEKVSAFIFKGDLVSAKVYSKRKINMQQFIPEMIHSLLRALNYIHREGLVHMELNLKTVMIDKATGVVKLCHMCKPREAIFPADLGRATKSYVCLAPSVLQGNVYESTDDIYAFGLLLWELLFPDNLPFKEQRLWALKRFIEKCHPANMLQGNLNDLQISDSVQEVLKGTLLISRGHVSMSVATIQSLLVDLHNEPVVLSMQNNQDLPDVNNKISIALPAPEVQVISPTGTGTRLEFTFDGLLVDPDGSSLTKPETSKNALRKSYSSGKLSSMHEDHSDKKGKGLFPPKTKRSTSEPDIKNNIESSSSKPKKRPLQFLNKWFKIGSSKKSLGDDSNPSVANDIIESNSRRGSALMPQEIVEGKRGSAEFDAPELRQKCQSTETENRNPFDSRRHVKHNSLPSQAFFGSKTGSLARKESFDVPTLMSEKFRLSLGNRLPRKSASRLDPLSSLNSDSSLSGSMPSLLFLSESIGHNNTKFQQKQLSARYLACSSNPRIQTHISPSSKSRTNGLAVPQDASSPLKQSLQFGGSLHNLSGTSLNDATYSSRPLLKDTGSAQDLHDKYSAGNFVRTNHAIHSRKANSWHRQPSPLTVPSENEVSLPNESSSSSALVTNMTAAENKSTLLLSSSTSSRGADSGFSTDASGPEAKDLLGLFSFGNSIGDKNHINDDIDYNVISHKSQNVQTNNLTTNVGKISPFRNVAAMISSPLNNYKDDTDDDRGNHTAKTKGLSLQDLSDDSEDLLHKYVHPQRSEPLCDSRKSSSIPPPPPPINFSELSFTFGGNDYDSDE